MIDPLIQDRNLITEMSSQALEAIKQRNTKLASSCLNKAIEILDHYPIEKKIAC